MKYKYSVSVLKLVACIPFCLNSLQTLAVPLINNEHYGEFYVSSFGELAKFNVGTDSSSYESNVSESSNGRLASSYKFSSGLNIATNYIFPNNEYAFSILINGTKISSFNNEIDKSVLIDSWSKYLFLTNIKYITIEKIDKTHAYSPFTVDLIDQEATFESLRTTLLLNSPYHWDETIYLSDSFNYTAHPMLSSNSDEANSKVDFKDSLILPDINYEARAYNRNNSSTDFLLEDKEAANPLASDPSYLNVDPINNIYIGDSSDDRNVLIPTKLTPAPKPIFLTLLGFCLIAFSFSRCKKKLNNQFMN